MNTMVDGKDASSTVREGGPPGGGAGALAHSDPSAQSNEGKEENRQTHVTAQKGDEQDLPPFLVPPLTAIAGVLIDEWAHGRIGPRAGKRGHL
jgi:NAD+ diphosphatase